MICLSMDAFDVVKVQLCASCKGNDCQTAVVNGKQGLLCLVSKQIQPCKHNFCMQHRLLEYSSSR